MSNEPSVTGGQLPTRTILGGLSLFRGEDPEFLDGLLDSCGVRSLEPGEVLLDPHRDNDALYIILSGRAEVKFSQEHSGSGVYLEPGECAGEMSIIEGGPPSARVVAHSRCRVLVIDAEIVWALIDQSPVVARNLLYILSTRVRRNNLALVHSHAQQRIHQRDALTDSMTGLFNRRWMEVVLAGIVERCARNQQELALLMIDTDHFKRYNDEHGHLAGDRLLIRIARRITRSIRPTDFACRYGGDEFVVVLPQADRAEALQVGERLCRAVREEGVHAANGGSENCVSVSVGIARLDPHMNMRQLLMSADAALYRAKAAGRGRVSG